MERKFMASFYYYNVKNDRRMEEFANTAIGFLGFEPSVMSVSLNNGDAYDEVKFDKMELLSLLARKPISLRLMNQVYDESGGNHWFLLKNEENGKISAHWSLPELDFLLNERINYLIGGDDFMCGYCFDQVDCGMQSITDLSIFKIRHPDVPFRTVKNNFKEDIVDISEHWGRRILAAGLDFMAAPLMWFGEQFYDIIPKNRLLEFPYSSLLKNYANEVVKVSLFEITSPPSLPVNRIRQKEFWTFFDLTSTAEKYAKDYGMDPVLAFKEYLNRINRKKR